jgi:hypothetical protein
VAAPNAQHSATLRLLERLGCDPRPIDRTGGTHPFATGTRYAACPRCASFAAISIEGDGIHWRGLCECWNPRDRHDDLDLILLSRAAA